jgi:medium-chain acyl-[acyl-carrier-protein] hydrolase
MNVKLTRNIRYAEIDANFQWKLGFLFRSLLEVAVKHSEKVGLGSRLMVDNGFVWILNRIGLEVVRYPEYRESVDVVTWSRGYKGFKAFRDFEIYAGPERIAAGTSVWLYLDLQRKRLHRIPPDIHEAYKIVEEKALGKDISTWKPPREIDPDFEVAITTRNSDFDPLGHVNSAVYFDYLDTLASRFGNEKQKISALCLQYTKEIDRSVQSVTAELGSSGGAGACRFGIRSAGVLHASGEMWLEKVM